MSDFETRHAEDAERVAAPDGSAVLLLPALARGSMARFELDVGAVTRAVVHRSVEELWYVTEGRGELWRKLSERESVVELVPGSALSIPVGTHFQFRNRGDSVLRIIGVTMPPWPGENEAVPVEGPWEPRGVSGA